MASVAYRGMRLDESGPTMTVTLTDGPRFEGTEIREIIGVTVVPEPKDETFETQQQHTHEVAQRGSVMTRLPDRVVVGANGAYWRDYGDFYSMCPVSDDNDPVVPVAVYAMVGAQGLGRTDPVQAREIDRLVLAAMAWSDHPTPANIGRLHAAVARYRGLDTPE